MAIFHNFTIAQRLVLLGFLSVSLVRENLRGLRENLEHKIRSLEDPQCLEREQLFPRETKPLII